ncbi:MAG: cation:proton antiporter [Candidatus Aenigmarchaeota archaeon]|nr:cation:proton antiporter [Candidatus Aenigmarchaeota archaeon]
MITIAISVLFLAAFLVLVLKKDMIAISAIVFSFFFLIFIYLAPETMVFAFSGWNPPFGIVWVLDGLGLFMALLITGIMSLTAIYSVKYIKKRKHRYYTLLCLLTIGLLGISLTGDIFNMYVFFELMSVSSYALVAFLLNKESTEAAFKYLVVGSLSSSFLLLGIAMLYGLAGTLNMADLATKVYGGPAFLVVLGLILGGLSLKSAIVPFHFWLPDVHPAAPSPVSALLSSVIVGSGVYMMIRVIFTVFGIVSVFWMLILLGLVTMILGGLMALIQKDAKRLIAYSTVSQIGYIFVAIGIGTSLGVTAGLFHLLNNILLKSLLFMSFGIVLWHTGTRDMNRLGGIGKQMPWVAFCFGVGALGTAGVPPLNGFASKWLIYMATWQVSPVITAIAIIVSAITMAYYIKVFSCIFMGHSNIKIVNKTPKMMLIPVIIITIMCIVIGIFPQIGIMFVEPATNALLNQSQYINAVLGGSVI